MASTKSTARKTEPLTPKVVLGVAAHPDDLDFGMAGSVATWAAQGADIYYLILTNGNKGSADHAAQPKALTECRRQEQREAARICGVKDVYFCDYEDGLLEVTPEVKKDIVRVIRRVRPEVVMAMDPTMIYNVEQGFINHPDHRAAGQATLDAVYPLARDHLSFPELDTTEHLAPHNVATVLLVNFDRTNYAVNITDTIEKKMAALAAHASQMPNLAATQTRMRSVAAQSGKDWGVQYAETFLRIDIAG